MPSRVSLRLCVFAGKFLLPFKDMNCSCKDAKPQRKSRARHIRNQGRHLSNRMSRFLLLSVILFVCSFAGLAQAPQQVTLRGQVVCSVCWFEATDRKKTPYGNAADIKCALECSEQGIPQALAVEDEKGFTLYTLEKGTYKSTSKDFLDLVPKSVEIEGELRTEKDKKFVKVNSLKVLEAPQPKPTP